MILASDPIITFCSEVFFVLVFIFIVPCVFAEGEAEVKTELGEETGLVEEDLVAVSYMGDELDLETVGDIIAIIEEKVHTVSMCERVHIILHQHQYRVFILSEEYFAPVLLFCDDGVTRSL